MKISNFKPALVLTVICIISALLLSSINIFTAPIIEERKNAATTKALTEVFPGGTDFKEINLTEYKIPDTITRAYSEGSGGYVIESTVKGYKPGLIILCGIDSEGKIVGVKYTQSNETLGAEVGLGNRFVGKGADEMTPDIVAGSTAKLTTGAYYKAVVDALSAAAVFGGGEFDDRSPEKILQDNCNAALGTADVTFTKWFATEVIDGIDAVYESEGNVGRVFVIGEEFIGVNATGEVVTEGVSTENATKATSANTIVAASSTTEVTAIPDGVDTDIITGISVTASGNYVFELKTSGYKKLNHYYKEDKPIYIKLSISADGRIIDCVTTEQHETEGIGDVCATEEYCDQYKGATDDDIKISSALPGKNQFENLIPSDTTDIGAISGATFTTYGYQKAVKAAFAAFEILTGGN